MVVKIISGAVTGIEGYKVDVEVDISQGLPCFDIVGLPDSAVKEARERVRSAIKNSGCNFPTKHITVNLAPADMRKEGPSFDLPIAVAILACIGEISYAKTNGVFISGELSLDGEIKPVNGMLPMVCHMKEIGINKAIVPFGNKEEGSLVDGLAIAGVKDLKELISFFKGKPLEKTNLEKKKPDTDKDNYYFLDFIDVKGQENVKRALEVGAAGAHNLLMIGPPGSGKTMMAKRLPGILPNLTFSESLEVTKIYSVAGILKDKGTLLTVRPFRSPHHTISYSALVGGGRIPGPGEISLAHKGVLFLDELPEFHRNVLEVMRQPLEEGMVTISRVNGTLTYPSDFMLLASMNPCLCGFYGDSDKCVCTQNEISRYLNKISGPLLDRIDIQVEASAVDYKDLGIKKKGESSEKMKERVIKAMQIQRERYENEKITTNSQLTASLIEKHCQIDGVCSQMLKMAFDNLKLSARAYHKILKVSRTIADLDLSENIEPPHLAEAIQYRSLDRKYWG